MEDSRWIYIMRGVDPRGNLPRHKCERSKYETGPKDSATSIGELRSSWSRASSHPRPECDHSGNGSEVRRVPREDPEVGKDICW
jgi:hypothetical protein